MTKRERITAALRRQEVDRLPWSPLIDDYFVRSLPEQGLHMDLLEVLRYLRCDIMERHVPALRLIRAGVEECRQ
ncbi:MAG: hypothetical protein IJ048_00515 [Clostridia bacterium]|nr:hypothetical protein [Clostridia bacterium]